MTLFKNIIFNQIKKYFNLNYSFLILYSGGIDSSVLLHLIIKLKKIYTLKKNKFRVLHINHKIQSKSYSWYQHCKKECQKYNINLIYKEINQKIQEKSNTEEKARKARLKIIQKILQPKEIIITGHHLNDQCETLLLALTRGSGIDGLSGMKECSYMFHNILLRPLLNVPKKKIYQYAIENNIKWIEDSSNFDIHYNRNFLRKKIIPLIENKWPNFIYSCYKTSQLFHQNKFLIEYFIKNIYKKYLNSDLSLNIKFINKYNIEIHNIILRKWFFLHIKKMPTTHQLNKLYFEVIKNKKKNNPIMLIKNYEIQKYKQNIYFFINNYNIKNTSMIWNKPYNILKLPLQIGYISKKNVKNKTNIFPPAPLNNQIVKINFFLKKKMLFIYQKKHTTIKKMWQKFNIPPWQRNKIPLLFYDDEFIGAIGLFYTKQNQINKKNWEIHWFHKIKQSH
ncbi:tRNA lysidine(34) synthetase TilS [Buchnera aphidicola (Thelaxes californica)]|uniref:tRNA(Ile)-lysidine synthase n=1 Tax=Buchnera aphidicola (Thelaxes californica) TaxID=1315998 RepID=A0A4D6YA51_9GAMM|nr:tRNA lysidine(34) synthetase TilS [Buchnera aphidicola]QCI26647.1 tRNA lysidine(34) synthetase TilS [Buchnera aphidicola (Thelaxes californica)]